MSEVAEPGAGRMDAGSSKGILIFSQHWLAWLNVLVGIWVGLPWLAPILMHVGASGPANMIYLVYSPQCHQLPQRSYFLFGDRLMVPLRDILAVYPTSDPLLLRPFLGTPTLGWKVAWSDRMVSLFTPLFVGGLLYGLSGKRWKPQPWRWWLLMPYLPLMLDGSSHSINDLLHLGVRETNEWLAVMTRMYQFPPGARLAMIGADRRRCVPVRHPHAPTRPPLHRRFAISQRCAAVRHPQSPGRSTLHYRVGFRHPQ